MKYEVFVIAVGGQGKRLEDYFLATNFNKSKIFFEVNGAPIIQQLIDTGLNSGFKEIYLLVSHHQKEIRDYLKQQYPKNKEIIPVYGAVKGIKYGVPYFFDLLKNQLKERFVYSDGNILYSADTLRRMQTVHFDKDQVVAVAVSKYDMAPTHSLFGIKGYKLVTVKARVHTNINSRRDLTKTRGVQKFCSLGLMTFDSIIFRQEYNFASCYDLDNVIEEIFDKNNRAIKVIKTRGRWFALHTKADIDKIS
ncbi:MAG: sugar phosphate nucleotidyltransferase [Candidatus Komeilibacteria bacterium]